MNIYFSDFFGVAPDILKGYGAFDVSLLNDLPLFVDPFLLFTSDSEDYQRLHNEILRYLTFLRDKASSGIADGLLSHWFRFPEVRQNWLGYSLRGNRGTGLGPKFADALNRNLEVVFAQFGSEAITRSSHLEKLCLIRSGVGRDNVSDFVTNLIKYFLAEYTQRFATSFLNSSLLDSFVVEKARFDYPTERWVTATFTLPRFGDDYVLLTPRDLLTKDEIWINRNDLVGDFEDIVAAIDNSQLRDLVSAYFLRRVPDQPTEKQRSEAVDATLAKYPQVIDYYIRDKEESGYEAQARSRAQVDESEGLYIANIKAFVEGLLVPGGFYDEEPDSFESALQRALFLKRVIEDQDGWRLFYLGGQPIASESDLHIMYRLTWFATRHDVNREVNNGRGPVDFKVSSGASDRALVEFKLAKNTKLGQNLAKQVDIYKRASETERAIKVIVYFSESELNRVLAILEDLGISGHRDIVLIDAIPQKLSASNVKR